MAKSEVPAPPRGTRVNGRKLWGDVLSKFELEQHELALLGEMVRTVDLLDQLAAIVACEGLMVQGPRGSKPHPAVIEARQARIALARLTAAAPGRGARCLWRSCGGFLMRRRPEDVGEWVLNGVVYPSEAARDERVAFDERCRARRVRLLALIEAEET